PFAPCTQLLAKPGVAPHFIVTRYPAIRNLLAPQVEHLQALLVACLIAHVLGHVAGLASLRILCPILRQGQAKIEHGMVVATDISHQDANLAIVDLAPVTTPRALDAYRTCAALGKAARITGDDPIGFPQPLD